MFDCNRAESKNIDSALLAAKSEDELFLTDNGSTGGSIDTGYAVEVMPDLCGTQLKSFSLRSMIRVDLRKRDNPRSHLMIASGFRSGPFVMSPYQILLTLTVGLTLLAIAVVPVVALARWVALAGFISSIVLSESLWHAVLGRRAKRQRRQGRRETRARHAEVWL